MTHAKSILAAMLTPFTESGAVSAAGVGPLVEHILSQGVHGLYASGSSGESVLQSLDERTLLLTELANCARGRCHLVAQVGSASTGDALALAKLARRLGYDAVSAVPPYYYKHTFADILSYYRAIADAAGIAGDCLQYPRIERGQSVDGAICWNCWMISV